MPFLLQYSYYFFSAGHRSMLCAGPVHEKNLSYGYNQENAWFDHENSCFYGLICKTTDFLR